MLLARTQHSKGFTEPNPHTLPSLSLQGHRQLTSASSPQFVTLCALAKPGAYTDGSLLGLIELLCRAGLDMRLCLQPKTDLQQLLLLLLENIQDWPGKV